MSQIKKRCKKTQFFYTVFWLNEEKIVKNVLSNACLVDNPIYYMIIYIVDIFIKGGVYMEYFVSSLTELFARFIVVFTAITVHEYAHGLAAYKLGDPTAKYAGRLSLNPLKHLDPWGALCMLLFRFGWAKPVPINPMYFKDRKRDSAITAVAGPLANILLSFLSTILFALFYVFVYNYHLNFITQFIYTVFVQLAMVNISFAIFNLIPFPPLDGSKILGAFLSYENYNKLLTYERLGFPMLIILSLTGLLGRILSLFITPILSLWKLTLNWLINILL